MKRKTRIMSLKRAQLWRLSSPLRTLHRLAQLFTTCISLKPPPLVV
jgi:hypothetical protein